MGDVDAKCTGTGHYRFYHYAVGHLQTLPARDQKTPEAKALAQEELIKMGPVTRDERVTIGIFLLSLLAWSTSKWTGLDATAVALSGVCLMLMTRIITWQDVQSEKGA